jgi:DNA polymerase-4
LRNGARRPGARRGANRWQADRAIDAIRERFGREAVAYGEVFGGGARSVPDGFRELAEKEL